MSLEQRVQKLEDEVKILKNQIQNTLLEIQAEIMNHYYTSLRAENDLQEDKGGSKRGEDSANNEHIKEASRAIPQETQAKERATDDTPRPPVQPSTQGKRSKTSTKESAHTPESAGGASPVDWVRFAKLTRWVSETTEEIGARNTKKVIETCQAQSHDDDHMLESLLPLISSEESKENVPTDRILTALAQLTELLAGNS